MNNMLSIDVVAQERRNFARSKAREIYRELREYDERGEGEYFLAAKLADALSEYEAGLERMCNYYHSEACKALNLKLPPPFVIPISEKP